MTNKKETQNTEMLSEFNGSFYKRITMFNMRQKRISEDHSDYKLQTLKHDTNLHQL